MVIEYQDYYPITEYQPPELVVESSQTTNLRISQVTNYKNYLIEQTNFHKNQLNNFKKWDTVYFVTGIIIFFIDIIVNVLGIIKNVLVEAAQLSIFMTTLAMILKTAATKIRSRFNYHSQLFLLSKTKLEVVESKYNDMIKDGDLDHKEFLMLVDIFKKYEEMRDSVSKPV